jgi:hypothetical protein
VLVGTFLIGKQYGEHVERVSLRDAQAAADRETISAQRAAINIIDSAHARGLAQCLAAKNPDACRSEWVLVQYPITTEK